MKWMATFLVAAQVAGGTPMTVARGDSSAIEESREVVARTVADWEALWRAHSSSAPAPRVDFAERMVVGVFLGARPTAGYGVEVIEAAVENDALAVRWVETRPAPGALTAQVVTSPFHMVTIPRYAGRVTFRKVEGR